MSSCHPLSHEFSLATTTSLGRSLSLAHTAALCHVWTVDGCAMLLPPVIHVCTYISSCHYMCPPICLHTHRVRQTGLRQRGWCSGGVEESYTVGRKESKIEETTLPFRTNACDRYQCLTTMTLRLLSVPPADNPNNKIPT